MDGKCLIIHCEAMSQHKLPAMLVVGCYRIYRTSTFRPPYRCVIYSYCKVIKMHLEKHRSDKMTAIGLRTILQRLSAAAQRKCLPPG